jgi:hypothetical protein
MKVGDGTPGPGRPKGSINEKTRELLEWGSEALSNPQWRKGALKRMSAGEAPHLETYLLHRIHGKPKEVMEVQSTIPLFALPAGAFVAVVKDEE